LHLNVIGLPKLKFERETIGEVCQQGKQTKNSFKHTNIVSTSKPLELFHMNLFGPFRTMNIGGNYYSLVIVYDFSRFPWTLFVVTKDDAFISFKRLAKLIQNEKKLHYCY